MSRACLLALLFALVLPTKLVPQSIHVGEDKAYRSISEAVKHAQPGDIITVHPGLYNEHSIVIDKPIFLQAKPGAIIDAADEPADIFTVTADSVTISGFELTRVGVSFRKEYAAIRLRRVKNASITNNRVTECFFGIYLEYTRHSLVHNNQILGKFKSEASAGNAIHAWKGNHLTISNNTVQGHRDGIYFEFVDDSVIKGNISRGNLRYGLHFMFSNRDEYRNNEFRANGSGVAVMFSNHIVMASNTFINNWGSASYGLLLKEISDGEITHNKFVKNTIGVLAEGANRLQISQNQFSVNGTALDMKGNCLDNTVEANNFLANTFEVVTNSKYNTNTYHMNYWSGYSGYDLNRDGYGDVPYRPVNLFAKITSEIPSATIMLHSVFVNILEAGEKIFPQLIPEELIDEKPKMRPYNYD